MKGDNLGKLRIALAGEGAVVARVGSGLVECVVLGKRKFGKGVLLKEREATDSVAKGRDSDVTSEEEGGTESI